MHGAVRPVSRRISVMWLLDSPPCSLLVCSSAVGGLISRTFVSVVVFPEAAGSAVYSSVSRSEDLQFRGHMTGGNARKELVLLFHHHQQHIRQQTRLDFVLRFTDKWNPLRNIFWQSFIFVSRKHAMMSGVNMAPTSTLLERWCHHWLNVNSRVFRSARLHRTTRHK